MIWLCCQNLYPSKHSLTLENSMLYSMLPESAARNGVLCWPCSSGLSGASGSSKSVMGVDHGWVGELGVGRERTGVGAGRRREWGDLVAKKYARACPLFLKSLQPFSFWTYNTKRNGLCLRRPIGCSRAYTEISFKNCVAPFCPPPPLDAVHAFVECLHQHWWRGIGLGPWVAILVALSLV